MQCILTNSDVFHSMLLYIHVKVACILHTYPIKTKKIQIFTKHQPFQPALSCRKPHKPVIVVVILSNNTFDCLQPQFMRFWNLSIWNVLRNLFFEYILLILFKFKVFMKLQNSIAPVLQFGSYWYISLPSHRPFCKWAPIYYVTIFCSPLDSVKIDFPQHPFFSTILYRLPPQLNLFLGIDTGGEAVSLIC